MVLAQFDTVMEFHASHDLIILLLNGLFPAVCFYTYALCLEREREGERDRVERRRGGLVCCEWFV